MLKKKTDTSKEEELKEDAETDEAEEESDEESESEEESEEEESEEEDESSHNDSEIDYDAEIEKEKEKGKPDKDKAKEAFQARKSKRSDESEDDADENDKPFTKRELQEHLARVEKKALETSAYQLAKSLSASDKEAMLIVEKWKNRIFPEDMSLMEQLEEMYVSIHRKKLIGDRNEALRALKNKGRVNNNAATTHRDSAKGSSTPKVPEADKRAILAAGYVWNANNGLFEKKLSNGNTLAYDPKSKKTKMVPSQK